MKQTAGNALIATATTLGAGSSYLGWIGHHSAALGVIISFASLIGAIVFHVLNLKKATKADSNEQKIIELNILVKELERENATINEGK